MTSSAAHADLPMKKKNTPHPMQRRLGCMIVIFICVGMCVYTASDRIRHEITKWRTPVCDAPAEWQIAFVHNQDIYVWGGGVDEPSKLIDEDWSISYVVFSPDGRYMAYSGYRGKNRYLAVANADGTEQREVMVDEKLSNSWSSSWYWFGPDTWLWSPDGTHLALQIEEHENAPLYTYDVAASELVHIADNVGGWRWSPDSQRIYYTVESDILTTTPDGSEVTVWREHSRVPPLLFSPDGEYVVYGESGTGFWESKSYVASPQSPEPIFILRGLMVHAWSPGGRFLIYTSDIDNDSAKYLDVQTGVIDLVAKGAFFWGWHKDEILYSVGRQLYSRELPDGEPTLIYEGEKWPVRGPAAAPVWPTWYPLAPGGQFFYFAENIKGRDHILTIINLDDGSTKRLTNDTNMWGVQWSPDGQLFVYQNQDLTFMYDGDEQCRWPEYVQFFDWQAVRPD